jgi:hypothetical protein
MRRLALVALAALLAAPALGAQSTPPRPTLAADADTNDARAYYRWGNRPDVDWKNTYNAYYWAQRLDPADIAYLNALYFAFLYRHPASWRLDYDRGRGKAAKSEDAAVLDSMYAEMLLRDPYGSAIGTSTPSATSTSGKGVIARPTPRSRKRCARTAARSAPTYTAPSASITSACTTARSPSSTS